MGWGYFLIMKIVKPIFLTLAVFIVVSVAIIIGLSFTTTQTFDNFYVNNTYIRSPHNWKVYAYNDETYNIIQQAIDKNNNVRLTYATISNNSITSFRPFSSSNYKVYCDSMLETYTKEPYKSNVVDATENFYKYTATFDNTQMIMLSDIDTNIVHIILALNPTNQMTKAIKLMEKSIQDEQSQ